MNYRLNLTILSDSEYQAEINALGSKVLYAQFKDRDGMPIPDVVGLVRPKSLGYDRRCHDIIISQTVAKYLLLQAYNCTND